MSGWHIDERVAAAYAARMLGTVERASVEAHAVRCDGCRSRIGGLSVQPDGALDPERLWARIETRVVEPPIGRLTSWLLRLGLGEPDAAVLRMLGAQSRQWTIASTLVLALSALAAAVRPVSTAPAAFLVLAPLLPPLGVAATYRAMPHGMSLLETTSPYQPARMLRSVPRATVSVYSAPTRGTVPSSVEPWLIIRSVAGQAPLVGGFTQYAKSGT